MFSHKNVKRSEKGWAQESKSETKKSESKNNTHTRHKGGQGELRVTVQQYYEHYNCTPTTPSSPPSLSKKKQDTEDEKRASNTETTEGKRRENLTKIPVVVKLILDYFLRKWQHY